MPSTSRRPSLLTPTATITADRDDAAVVARLHIGGVDPQIGPVALDRPVEEGLHLAVDLLAQPADLALRDARPAHRLDQIVDRPGRDAVDVGLLDDRGQRLLGQPPRLEKAGKIAALAQLRDAQLDRSGPRLPSPLAIAVALREPIRAPLAIGRAGQRPDLQLHQPFGGEADHLAQNIGVGGLLHQRAKVHHLVGHRWISSGAFVMQPDPTGEPPMTTPSYAVTGDTTRINGRAAPPAAEQQGASCLVHRLRPTSARPRTVSIRSHIATLWRRARCDNG